MAQSLRTRTSRFLGVIIPSITNPFVARVLLAIRGTRARIGIRNHPRPDPQSRGTRGGVHPAASFPARGRPFHFAGLSPPTGRADLSDSAGPARARRDSRATARPFAANFPMWKPMTSRPVTGRRSICSNWATGNIAFFAGPQAAPWAQERFEGYRRALREADLEIEDRLIFQAGSTIEDGAKAALQFVNESVPATAIQAVNDLVAIGCANTFLDQGIKIPRAPFGGRFRQCPHQRIFSRSADHHPAAQIRAWASPRWTACSNLFRGERPENKRLPAEIIVRQSTAAPAR